MSRLTALRGDPLDLFHSRKFENEAVLVQKVRCARTAIHPFLLLNSGSEKCSVAGLVRRMRNSLWIGLACLALIGEARADILPPGNRAVPLGVHALVGGKVVVKPGQTLDSATVLIRDGLIEKVGTDVVAPPDARVWDMKGLTIYAGFIDPYLTLGTNAPSPAPTNRVPELRAGRFFGLPLANLDPGNPGPGSELPTVTPEHRMVEGIAPDPKALQTLRELGFTVGNVVPARGIIRGTSVLLALSDSNPNEAVIRPDVFQHVAFESAERGEGPGSYPQSLMGIISAVRQSFFDAQHYFLEHQSYDQAPQGRKRPAFNPASQALGPALRKEMPVVFEPTSALMVDRAGRVGRELGLNFYILASGQEWRRPDLAKGAGAPFIVPLNFPEISKMPEEDDWNAITLDQLRAWDWAPEDAAVLRAQNLEVALTTYDLEDKTQFRKNLASALDRGFSENDALAALTTIPAKLCGVEQSLGTVEAGKMANLTVVSGKGYFDPEAKVKEVWIDGQFYRTDTAPPKAEAATEEKPAEAKPDETKPSDTKPSEAKPARPNRAAAARELFKKRLAHAPLEGRGPLTNPPAVLLTNATVWTCGPAGRLEHASILIEKGKIAGVGATLRQPDGALVEDATGKHITPGLIDAHSHSMILGGVNEGTLPSSAMVRIGDVVNSESANIYLQLASGVTEAHLLHGSANPIGGQCCLIKLRDGDGPEDLKFEAAPPTIKFALGENVKQSNSERATTRFPQTRMGVQAFYYNRFTAAQQYLQAWDRYNNADKNAVQNGVPFKLVPPARDLELEALGEILQGKRFIHCHSYRQDEILMFIRQMQSFHIQIAAMHHILEGYKVADEMAAGGIGGSSFSDWWAYKFEVYDAIPYNGTLMHDRGVVVSFNSDSDDLARRLNFEAAKAVKYGGLSEIEALKFVTLNPAIQLRVQQRVGSLETGKDGDIAIWSKSPLDSTTVCLETWIEGKKYFDRSLDAGRTAALEEERKALLAKARKVLQESGPNEGGGGRGRRRFFETALEHQDDFFNHDRDEAEFEP
jgi:imidazolonepropionase-like amidohydrolase